MSGASSAGFTLSGKWRQQFDWAVVEWNRDNTFDHPSFRPLPDGDLSSLVLTYREQRSNCVPLESNLVPIVDWNNLRIWAPSLDGSSETVYTVALNDPSISSPVSGSYIPASATMTLVASPGVGKRVGLAVLEQHFYAVVGGDDNLAKIAASIALNINQFSPTFRATSDGPSVIVTWALTDKTTSYPDLRGSNGNRLTMYGFAEDGVSVWTTPSASFSGGEFPNSYGVKLDFGALKAAGIPTDKVRKMRWTWAADLQRASFAQTEFVVNVSDWQVTGANRLYTFAGAGSRRIEDTDHFLSYVGSWSEANGVESGNFSGGRSHRSTRSGDEVTLAYQETAIHQLFIGTRRFAAASQVSISVDGQTALVTDLRLPAEDVLVRLLVGTFPPGPHFVSIRNSGGDQAQLCFDYLEIVYPTSELKAANSPSSLSLSTDWDTYHSQSLPAERTAWMISQLGFSGRVNHYAGALWFYELVNPGLKYSVVTLKFVLQESRSPSVILNLIPPATPEQPSPSPTQISHLILPDDSAENVVQALAALINLGTNLVWADADGNQLKITAREMGRAGDGIGIQVDPTVSGCIATPSAGVTSGGQDGNAYAFDSGDSLISTLVASANYWTTDITAVPRINKAARDWHAAYYSALKSHAIDVVTSFSTEMLNVDPSKEVGLAQRYADGTPVILNTPAVQTNFSPAAILFWQQVYLDMATLQANAGLTPYLQFGEIQWWYFPKEIWNNITGQNEYAGMPFYDEYTTAKFQSIYGRPLPTIFTNSVDPTQYSEETAFLSGLIGEYTSSIRSAVLAKYPNCRWEVLYPTDTNFTSFNQAINFAKDDWTPAKITSLKTESFGFTATSNLNQAAFSIGESSAKGFPNSQRAHLIGIGDSWSSWIKEANYAQSQGLQSITLFALDQYCLIGYPLPPFDHNFSSRRFA